MQEPAKYTQVNTGLRITPIIAAYITLRQDIDSDAVPPTTKRLLEENRFDYVVQSAPHTDPDRCALQQLFYFDEEEAADILREREVRVDQYHLNDAIPEAPEISVYWLPYNNMPLPEIIAAIRKDFPDTFPDSLDLTPHIQTISCTVQIETKPVKEADKND